MRQPVWLRAVSFGALGWWYGGLSLALLMGGVGVAGGVVPPVLSAIVGLWRGSIRAGR